MGIVADIADLLVRAHTIWRQRHGESDADAQRIYDKYIAPSYKLLKEVHADYLELYLTLEARFHLEDELSEETLRWFARGRVSRQADRSELLVLNVPALEGRSDRTRDANVAVSAYFSAVRWYFVPVDTKRDGRPTLVTPTTMTELRLALFQNWSRLSVSDQRAVAAEDYLATVLAPANELDANDDLIHRVMSAVRGDFEPGMPAQLAALEKSADTLQAALFDEGQRIPRVSGSRGDDAFSWRAILSEHCERQRWVLERGMQGVQETYIRVRVLLDRT